MKRTLLAVGVAVLISMMLIPRGDDRVRMWLPFFYDTAWLPWNTSFPAWGIQWTPFVLQTVFAGVSAAVIANLLPRRPRK